MGHTPRELFNYTRYSTQNNISTATLPRCYFIIDGQSILVSNNHSWIPIMKSPTHIRHLLGSGRAKRHDEGLNVTEYPMSKAQDFVMPLIKHMRPGHTQCQNRSCLTCSRIQLYLVTCSLSLNAQYQILYQNAKPYYQTSVLSNRSRLCYQDSQFAKSPVE